MKKLLAAVVLAAGAVTPLVAASPSHAVTASRCYQTDFRVCAGMNVSGDSIRGVGNTWGNESDRYRANTSMVILQRRHCGGSWINWATRHSPASHVWHDRARTTWVAKPKHYQFRAVVTGKIIRVSDGAVIRRHKEYSKVYGKC